MLTTRQLLEPLARRRTTEVVVTTMSTVRPWGRLSNHPLDFASADSAMGHAADFALGIALASPDRRVVCFNGDGSMLMSLGTLATITGAGASNLILFVVDNGCFEITGHQPVAGAVDYGLAAVAAGFPSVFYGLRPGGVRGPVRADLHRARTGSRPRPGSAGHRGADPAGGSGRGGVPPPLPGRERRIRQGRPGEWGRHVMNLKSHIRTIPDFPSPGIQFRDITPLLADPGAFGAAVDGLRDQYRDRKITAVAAAEARGFIFAAPLALALGAAFVPIRKPGKLPFDTTAFHYELEYGSDTLEMHTDAFGAGDRVLLVDDLLATGGTMHACLQLVRRPGVEVVGCAFVIELTGLGGRQRLEPAEVFSLVQY